MKAVPFFLAGILMAFLRPAWAEVENHATAIPYGNQASSCVSMTTEGELAKLSPGAY